MCIEPVQGRKTLNPFDSGSKPNLNLKFSFMPLDFKLSEEDAALIANKVTEREDTQGLAKRVEELESEKEFLQAELSGAK